MNVATHEAIRRAQGVCAECQINARDLTCEICGRSFCAACIKRHGHSARERYLYRVWSGQITTAPPDEVAEAGRMFDETT